MLEARRLTGPNLVFEGTGAVLEIELPTDGTAPPGAGARHAAWAENVRELVAALKLKRARPLVRRHGGGLSLAMTAPRDVLYTATEILEAAWQLAGGEDGPRPRFEDCVATLRASLDAEARPALLALELRAGREEVPLLADDEQVTLGYGARGRTWPVDALPEPDDVPWSELGPIPTALVTGTNGKTTTVRLLAAILREAGHVTGLSSTDALQVDDELLDAGDWSGPGGARAVLRDRRVQAAVLETARGGLLRRGLNVPFAQAAAVLNVAEDHFGEWGVHNLEDLADAKLLVACALPREGRLVLNAEDPVVWERGARRSVPSLPFALDADNANLRACTEAGRDGLWIADGRLRGLWNGAPLELCAVSDIPLALGGAARHNLANALAAAGLALALDVPPDAVARGLTGFTGDAASNPGRMNLFALGGATALVDFAHNPHGLAALVEACAALPAERRVVVLGQAGDRDDAALHGLADALAPLPPDRVILKEMAAHARGRAVGEVVARLEARLREQGVPAERIEHAPSELDAVRAALSGAQPGDLLLLLTHAQRAEVLALLERLAADGWQPGAPLPG